MVTFNDIPSLLEDFSEWQEEHQICHVNDGADHFKAHPELYGNPEDRPDLITTHADLVREYTSERGPIILNRMGDYPEPRPRAHPEPRYDERGNPEPEPLAHFKVNEGEQAPLPHCDPERGFHVPMCGHGANTMGRLPDDPEPEDFASRMGHPGGHFG